jgi:hypothetical protein
METRQLRFVLEVSDLGIHYYSAVSQQGKVELQVALHKSGLISKIAFTSVNNNTNRKEISREEFQEALNRVCSSIDQFLETEDSNQIAGT